MPPRGVHRLYVSETHGRCFVLSSGPVKVDAAKDANATLDVPWLRTAFRVVAGGGGHFLCLDNCVFLFTLDNRGPL